MATISVSSTDRRDGKALALFARCADWQTGRTKDGRSFFAIPGSEAGLFHMTDSRECSCPDFQRAGNLCKHIRAVRLWMAAFKTGAVAPKPRPDATIEDERAALTPSGAEYLAALTDTPQQKSATTWTPCERQCGALLAPEHIGRFCNHCAEKSLRLLDSMDTQDIESEGRPFVSGRIDCSDIFQLNPLAE